MNKGQELIEKLEKMTNNYQMLWAKTNNDDDIYVSKIVNDGKTYDLVIEYNYDISLEINGVFIASNPDPLYNLFLLIENNHIATTYEEQSRLSIIKELLAIEL